MRIEVTQGHIDEGKKADCNRCPIALAIAQHVKVSFKVGNWLVHFGALGSSSLPSNAFCFIQKFDSGQPVSPFSFDIEIPAEFLKCPT